MKPTISTQIRHELKIQDRVIVLFNSDEKTFLNNIDNKRVFIFYVVKGSLEINGTNVKSDELIMTSNFNDVIVNVDTIVLYLQISTQISNSFLCQPIKIPTLKYFEKYQAKISRINCSFNNIDLIRPWSIYLAELDFNSKIDLHIHKKLRNVLLFVGKPDEIIGYLIIRKDSKNLAFPLINGDVRIVSPSIIHNVIPQENSKLKFFVINDDLSDYENSANSDYHNEIKVSFSSLIFQERVNRYPTILNF